jgi:hypothetical protein
LSDGVANAEELLVSEKLQKAILVPAQKHGQGPVENGTL